MMRYLAGGGGDASTRRQASVGKGTEGPEECARSTTALAISGLRCYVSWLTEGGGRKDGQGDHEADSVIHLRQIGSLHRCS